MTKSTPLRRPEATSWSVDELLWRARQGELYIPAFQRSFRWDLEDILKLFDSVYRGYPIGDLLLWETERTEGATASFGSVIGAPGTGRGFVIVDGQQRVTSLVSVLLGGETIEDKFRIYFDLESEAFVRARPSESNPDTWLPLTEVADTIRFLRWLRSRSLPNELVNAANQLVRALRDYRIPIYVVHTPDEDQIREIFVRMNTAGKRLQASDVFDALQRGRQGMDLGTLARRLETLGFGALEEDWLLKAFAAVLGMDVTKNLGEALRSKSSEEVRAGLEATEQAIRRVIPFLRDDVGIPHIELLPYRFPLVPLTKLFYLIPEPSPRTRRRLAVWFWRGAWSGEHGRADAPTIRAVLRDVSDDEQRTIRDLLRSTPEPTEPFNLRSHDFRAAGTKLACTVLASAGPRHLATGHPIDVPRVLNERGPDALQTILRIRSATARCTENRLFHVPLEGISIRDAVLQASDEILESHCIPLAARDALREGQNETFLARRRGALETAVREFLASRVSPPPARFRRSPTE